MPDLKVFPTPAAGKPRRWYVDDKNLDPKTWCRFPILSGGFERELGELDKLR